VGATPAGPPRTHGEQPSRQALVGPECRRPRAVFGGDAGTRRPRDRRPRVEITATDINADILEEARKGTYATSQTTDIADELEPLDDYTKYIEQDGDTFQVRDQVKEMVTFEQHDLIRGDPKRDFDLVFCRNLLIYIDSEFKVPIFETIRGSLREGGYLMIGMTETLPAECRDSFEAVDKRHRIYRRV